MALPISFTTHINELPAEMIDHIMRYLPLADRKSASLVCKRWEEKAFSHHFLANIQLKLANRWEKHLDVKFLQKSWRIYRNVTVGYGIVVGQIMMVLKKFGKKIEVFNCYTGFRPRQLKAVFNRLPNIRRLMIDVICGGKPCVTPQKFPVLKHLVYLRTTETIFDIPGMDADRMMPSLRNLKMRFHSNVTENTSKALRSISARLKILEAVNLEYAPLELLDLRQLEMLVLRNSTFFDSNENEALRQLFVNVPMLSELYLRVPMTTSLFEVICNNCAQLTSFEFTIDGMNRASLSSLSKFTNLKNLHIDGYLTYHMIDGCEPLSEVKTFVLYWKNKGLGTERFAKQLHYMLPNVEIFYLLGPENNKLNLVFLRHFGKIFTNVKELTVEEFKLFPKDLRSKYSFNWIGDLVNVEHLTLRSMPMKRIGCQRGNTNVTSVTLENLDKLVGTSLLQVPDIFPSLRFLEIVHCALITAQDVELFRRVMPQCAINFIDDDDDDDDGDI